MPGRIVLYGATGYVGGLTAREMLAVGARPVLAGRDPGRLNALAARLSQAGDGAELETAVADAEPGQLRDLIRPGDVVVSTAGPFVKIGRPVVAAAVDAGAVYLDSSGEPPFIRQVFEEFGPRAEQTGAALLTAFGYDYVPGNLAGALALEAAGSAAARVRVGYFARGNIRGGTSAGTQASAADMLLEPGYAFRGGGVVTERTAAHVVSFEVDGDRKEAFSIGSSEHFALPRLRAATGRAAASAPLSEVGVYLGWFGRATRLVHYGSALASSLDRVPGVRRALHAQARRIQHSRSQPRAGVSIRTDVVALVDDLDGRPLAQVHLTGGDPYSFTAPLLAWAAMRAAVHGVRPAGALGPVEAFGLGAVESACAAAGFYQARPK
ncbi:saccharopine dehydrogenase NADP-binding domain-containing protein [Asanoa sp. NPDC050611]|uniref:saccharopine dehydrogenase NADP-binding domain-containing protein n=1 Tax=Asanoa sp. NPDC050611 TaxID=3157098 RepID=UPI0033F33969